jgi:hypothetical protein
MMAVVVEDFQAELSGFDQSGYLVLQMSGYLASG